MTYKSVDDYIAAQPAPAQSALRRVRATIRKALPGVAEGISYRIPVYKLDGRMMLYFAGFRHHYSIYPATPRLVAALGKKLAGILHSKATIRFPYGAAVPARLIARIAELRATEVNELAKARMAGRTATRKARPRAGAKATGRKSA